MNSNKRGSFSANCQLQEFFMTDNKIGFLRLKQILALIPVGKTTWWNGVKSGRYPKPVKLGPRITAWRAEDIHSLIERMGEP